MSAPDSAPGPTGPTGTDDDAPWPVMRRASTRFVRLCRAAAVVALAYGLYVALLALRDLDASAWLWVAIMISGLVHLAGVLGLWFLPPHSPSRLVPRPGAPGSGTAAARAAARTTLLGHADLDHDGRRLVALEVAGNARVPVVAAAAFAVLGPVAVGTPNTAHPLPWLGPVVAALALAVLVLLALQARAARRLHRAAQRADALPTIEDDGSPYTP